MSTRRAWPGLRGRRRECDTLSELLVAARRGHSQVLVLRGDAGIGKTALLDVLVERAAGGRIARAAGVESEMDLDYAGLHQLCGPFLHRLRDLPPPQRDALGAAFGLRAGNAPDRFLLGLAVLTLLSEVAEQDPLVCVIDDAQWLDSSSAQTLEFVARRLGAEPVVMVFAVRTVDDEPGLVGLPELELRGLSSVDAAALLEAAVPGPLDPRIRDRILAECDGNPLALLELPRALTATELAVGAPGAAGTTSGPAGRLEQAFVRQLTPLPRQSRRLLLTAAAEPVGDVTVLWRAAGRLGIGTDAATAAESSGLIAWGDRVRFRHPLVRSAVYRAADPAERREIHRALAEVTDPELDPDRRAWHRARAAVGTDEDVAGELERAADRALASGALGAAGAFFAAAAPLTPDPVRRARRTLAAATAKATAGAYDDASSLLAIAEAGPLGEAGHARVDLLRAQIADNSGHRNQALPLLLAAARRLEAVEPDRARETYLEALAAGLFVGRLGPAPAADLVQVAAAARVAPRPSTPGRSDRLLDAMAVLVTDGYTGAAPLLHRALGAFGGEGMTQREELHGSGAAVVASVLLWDDACWDALSRRQLQGVRRSGAVGLLSGALATRALFEIQSGNLAVAASLLAEREWVGDVIGDADPWTPVADAWLAAVRGEEERADVLILDGSTIATERGHEADLQMLQTARAVLCNGLGRYEDALVAALEAIPEPSGVTTTSWALAEAVEAGVRSGNRTVAARACAQLAVQARAGGSDWALGVLAARTALLHEDAADELFPEAIERLSRTRMRVELGRTHLLYGEWLRRQGRRVDARAQLRTAYELLTAMGVEAFADRAHRELLATGEAVRKRTVETQVGLTAQEAHIARLAGEGLTNPEIAAQLYLSPRTVEWHLRKVFTKVGISTRRQLRRSLQGA
jgi:DNA-binding CsgD family transcriptional regulator